MCDFGFALVYPRACLVALVFAPLLVETYDQMLVWQPARAHITEPVILAFGVHVFGFLWLERSGAARIGNKERTCPPESKQPRQTKNFWRPFRIIQVTFGNLLEDLQGSPHEVLWLSNQDLAWLWQPWRCPTIFQFCDSWSKQGVSSYQASRNRR